MIKNLKKHYMFWLLHRLPDCDQATRMMSDAMDRPLSLKQRLQLLLHNHVCDWCKEYLRQIKLLRKAAQHSISENKQADIYPDNGLSSEAKERIKRAMNSE